MFLSEAENGGIFGRKQTGQQAISCGRARSLCAAQGVGGRVLVSPRVLSARARCLEGRRRARAGGRDAFRIFCAKRRKTGVLRTMGGGRAETGRERRRRRVGAREAGRRERASGGERGRGSWGRECREDRTRSLCCPLLYYLLTQSIPSIIPPPAKPSTKTISTRLILPDIDAGLED